MGKVKRSDQICKGKGREGLQRDVRFQEKKIGFLRSWVLGIRTQGGEEWNYHT